MTIITGPAATGKTMYLDKLACESDYGCVLIDPYNKTEKGYANARLKWECMQKAGVKVYTSKELKELGILK